MVTEKEEKKFQKNGIGVKKENWNVIVHLIFLNIPIHSGKF